MIHPISVHFAVVLPLVALAFGIVYMVTKSEGMSKISSRAFLLAALGVAAAWYTGNHAGPLVYPTLDPEGQKDLLAHKQLGLYVAIAMGVVALIKIAGCKMKNFITEVLAIVLLLGVVGGIFKQSKMGGELVYEHGAGVQKYAEGRECLAEAAEMGDDEDDDE